MSLEKYNEKRNFSQTPKPNNPQDTNKGALKFVIQRHEASSLHYDFRLEMEGVLKSWAVPKGPSLNPKDKRLAMMVEDHPFSYRSFEGDIPDGNYGACHVAIWDEGEYYALDSPDRKTGEADLLAGLAKGSIRFVLAGKKLRGEFALVQMKGRQKNAWLLVKKEDEFALHEPYTSKDYLTSESNSKPIKAPSKKNTSAKTKKSTAKKAGYSEMPHAIKPMMAKLTDAAFDNPDWLFETKWDGYRAVAEVQNGEVQLYSRSGKSFNAIYQPVVKELQNLKHQVILDGEIVVLNEQGFPVFQDLQNYQNTPSEHLYYYVFDILHLDGEDLTNLPLIDRKARLEPILKNLKIARYSSHILENGIAYFKKAEANRLEGIMAKHARSTYKIGQRSDEWLKIKTHLRQEVVIGGYTAPQGSRKHIGALLLGVYEAGKLQYIGQSGSGFNLESLTQLIKKLEPMKQEESPFTGKVRTNRQATWVKPELVCEISFAEWTADNHVRQAIFEGLRTDKKATDVVRETMAHTTEIVEKKRRRKNQPQQKVKKQKRCRKAKKKLMVRQWHSVI